MATIYEARPMQIRAIQDDVIVIDMDMGEQVTSSGIVIASDDGKAHGVKPRWAKVYKVGPKQKEIQEGQWVLIEHGRWTRKVKINDGDGPKEIQKVEVKSILATSEYRPSDVYLGKEYRDGEAATIRPEDFGAR